MELRSKSKDDLLIVVEAFHKKMEELNSLRQQSVGESIPQVTVRVVGQFGLMIEEGVQKKLKPKATQDLDAIFLGGVERDILRQDLVRAGFNIDSDSEFIWIVPGAKFNTVLDTEFVKLEILDPLYNLVSKAVKAPEKNKNLIRRGLEVYGFELFQLIKEHGGDVTKFK